MHNSHNSPHKQYSWLFVASDIVNCNILLAINLTATFRIMGQTNN